MTTTRQDQRTIVFIPCGAEKAASACAAADLYVGSMFRTQLAAAQAIIDSVDGHGDIYIVSAKHGIVALDTIVEPYDVKMGDAGSVTADTIAAQCTAHGIVWGEVDVYTMLPKAYYTVVDTALRADDIYAADIYEADAGIGYQRGTCRSIKAA